MKLFTGYNHNLKFNLLWINGHERIEHSLHTSEMYYSARSTYMSTYHVIEHYTGQSYVIEL